MVDKAPYGFNEPDMVQCKSCGEIVDADKIFPPETWCEECFIASPENQKNCKSDHDNELAEDR